MSYLERRWARIRVGGRAKFILIYGVLGWGGLVAVLWVVAMSLLGHDRLLVAAIFPVGGVLWGWLMWDELERRHVRRRDPPA